MWRGPSLVNGESIAVILTGLRLPSSNIKTGPMLQAWVMPVGIDPTTAWRTGTDRSVCGGCPRRHRSQGGDGSCYVVKHHGPAAVYRAWVSGKYPAVTLAQAASLVAHRPVRLGAWGDPGAVPVEVWEKLLTRVSGWTGYTHLWRAAPGLRPWCMASIDSSSESSEAHALGWRTFRVRKPSEIREASEIQCPASKEAGRKLQCISCMRCSGRGSNVVVVEHGYHLGRVA